MQCQKRGVWFCMHESIYIHTQIGTQCGDVKSLLKGTLAWSMGPLFLGCGVLGHALYTQCWDVKSLYRRHFALQSRPEHGPTLRMWSVEACMKSSWHFARPWCGDGSWKEELETTFIACRRTWQNLLLKPNLDENYEKMFDIFFNHRRIPADQFMNHLLFFGNTKMVGDIRWEIGHTWRFGVASCRRTVSESSSETEFGGVNCEENVYSILETLLCNSKVSGLGRWTKVGHM